MHKHMWNLCDWVELLFCFIYCAFIQPLFGFPGSASAAHAHSREASVTYISIHPFKIKYLQQERFEHTEDNAVSTTNYPLWLQSPMLLIKYSKPFVRTLITVSWRFPLRENNEDRVEVVEHLSPPPPLHPPLQWILFVIPIDGTETSHRLL